MNQPFIQYSNCPICNSSNISLSLSAIDYTVSQQTFEVWECAECTARFTQKIPDAQHIGPYYQSENYISHSDTQKGLINALYHYVRSITLQQKRKFIEKITKGETKTLLDVGAGTGAFANTMHLAGWQVTGVEVDEGARNIAKNKYQIDLHNVEQLQQLQPASYQVITMWHVLEHVHDLHGYMQNFYKALKPGGKLIIAVPNYTSYDAQYYQQYWAAYDVPRHLYHFSPKSMLWLAQHHQFTIQQYKAMPFDSFYVAMLSEKYKQGNNNLLKAFWVGLLSTLHTLQSVKKCSSVIYVLQKSQ